MRASDLTARKSVLAHSKAVHGVSFDPFNDKRLSTFSEDGTSSPYYYDQFYSFSICPFYVIFFLLALL
jgi:hypothetical protein